VHDPAAVRHIQRTRDLDPVAQHLRQRQRPLGEAVGERLPLEQLHHQVIGAVVVADVVKRADVRVVEVGDRACLALETGADFRVRGEVGRQHLDRDVTTQAGIPGAVDLAHAARTERI
jgi:hypothetical protein